MSFRQSASSFSKWNKEREKMKGAISILVQLPHYIPATQTDWKFKKVLFYQVCDIN